MINNRKPYDRTSELEDNIHELLGRSSAKQFDMNSMMENEFNNQGSIHNLFEPYTPIDEYGTDSPDSSGNDQSRVNGTNSKMNTTSNSNNTLANKMMESLRNRDLLRNKMVFGHVYKHNNHTHIHGHVHNVDSTDCQLDSLNTLVSSENNCITHHSSFTLNPNNIGNHNSIYSSSNSKLPKAIPPDNGLVTVCCDKDHQNSKTGESEISKQNNDANKDITFNNDKNDKYNLDHSDSLHHLHQCTVSDVDLINSCFDFDFCDSVSCADFICDEFIHGNISEHTENLLSNNNNNNDNNNSAQPLYGSPTEGKVLTFNMNPNRTSSNHDSNINNDSNTRLEISSPSSSFNCPLFQVPPRSVNSDNVSSSMTSITSSTSQSSKSFPNLTSSHANTNSSDTLGGFQSPEQKNNEGNDLQKLPFVSQDTTHDRFVLNPLTNQIICVSCHDNTCAATNNSTSNSARHTLSQGLGSNNKSLIVNQETKRVINGGRKSIKGGVKAEQKILSPHNLNKRRKKQTMKCRWKECDHDLDLDSYKNHFLNSHIIPLLTSTNKKNALTGDDNTDIEVKSLERNNISETLQQSNFLKNGTDEATSLLQNYFQQHNSKMSNTDAESEPSVVENNLESILNSNILPMNLDCEWNDCDFHTKTSQDGLAELFMHFGNEHLNQEPSILGLSESEEAYKSSEYENAEKAIHINQNLSMSPSTVPINAASPSFTIALESTKHTSKEASMIKEQNPQTNSICEVTCQWCKTGNNGEICGCVFPDTFQLTEHIISEHVRSGKAKYVCCWDGCERNGREFTQRQKIVRHLHVHTKHKPFKCGVCSSSFPVESMLKQHMRVHSGEKPYGCKICGKRFAISSSLSIHMRTHTGEKPLCCKYPGCGKRFSESSNLAKHMKTHEKKFKCTECVKSFDKESSFKNHLAKHEKERHKNH